MRKEQEKSERNEHVLKAIKRFTWSLTVFAVMLGGFQLVQTVVAPLRVNGSLEARLKACDDSVKVLSSIAERPNQSSSKLLEVTKLRYPACERAIEYVSGPKKSTGSESGDPSSDWKNETVGVSKADFLAFIQAGFAGLIALVAWLSFELLRREQDRPEPSQAFLSKVTWYPRGLALGILLVGVLELVGPYTRPVSLDSSLEHYLTECADEWEMWNARLEDGSASVEELKQASDSRFENCKEAYSYVQSVARDAGGGEPKTKRK